MLFIPPYSSVLNPIEHWWSLVKGQWRKQMSKVQVPYNNAHIETDLVLVLADCARRTTENMIASIDPYLYKIKKGQLV